MAALIIIPQRDTRTFAHGADIYESCLRFINGQFRNSTVEKIAFRLRRPLGSKVEAQLDPEPFPSRDSDAEVDFEIESKSLRLTLSNAQGRIELLDTYHFDEELVKPALSENNGEYKFTSRIHNSNIHMILSVVKFVLPFWPKYSRLAQIAKMSFSEDVQKLDWKGLSLRVYPRPTFNVTTVFHDQKKIGEIVHMFLREDGP